MSVILNVSKNNQIGGISFAEARQISADAQMVHAVDVPKAEVGELTTRTGNETGTITMDDSSHLVTTGKRLDLYWEGGSRRGVAAGTVSGASVPVSGGAGDNLPVATTEIKVAIPVDLSAIVPGDDVRAILLSSVSAGQIVFADDIPAEIYFQPIGAGVSFIWHDLDGDPNPVAGEDIAKIWVSHEDITIARLMRVGILFNN